MWITGQTISAAWHLCKPWVFGAALIVLGFFIGRLYDTQHWREVATRQNEMLTAITDTDENILHVLMEYRKEFKGRNNANTRLPKDAGAPAPGVQGSNKLP